MAERVDLTTLFERFDPHGRGYFEKTDLVAVLGESHSNVERLFDELDKNGDGRISFDEFVDGYSRMTENTEERTIASVQMRRKRRKSSVADVAGERTARELFSLFDVNRRGMVSRLDMERGCRMAGLELGSTTVDSLFAELDVDGDGWVSCTDFERELGRGTNSVGSPGSESGVCECEAMSFEDNAFGTFESLAWEDAVANTGNTFSGASGTQLQGIWEEMKLSNPVMLGPFRDMMMVVSREMKKQQEENDALRRDMKRQSVNFESEVRALDYEASRQLESAEEEAKVKTAKTESRVRQKLLQQVRDKEKEMDAYLEKLAVMEAQLHELGDKDFELNATKKQLKEYQENNKWLQDQLEEREKKVRRDEDEVDGKMFQKRLSNGDVKSDITKLKAGLKQEKDQYSALNSELMRQLLDKTDEDTIERRLSEEELHRRGRLGSRPSVMSLYMEARGPVRTGVGAVIHGEVSAEELMQTDVESEYVNDALTSNWKQGAVAGRRDLESFRESDEELVAHSRDSDSSRSEREDGTEDRNAEELARKNQVEAQRLPPATLTEKFSARPFQRGVFRSLSLRQRRARPRPSILLAERKAKTLEDAMDKNASLTYSRPVSSLIQDELCATKKEPSLEHTDQTLHEVASKLEGVADEQSTVQETLPLESELLIDEDGCAVAVLPDRVFKVVLAGNSGVGKTSWIDRLCSGVFNVSVASTVGLDFRTKTVALDTGIVSIQFWDTAGQERYHSISRQYFRKADGVICMYDVTSWESLTSIRQWMAYIEDSSKSSGEIAMMILGNKTDLLPKDRSANSRDFIPAKRGAILAKEYGACFAEVSTLSGENVEESLYQFTTLLIAHQDEDLAKSVSNGGLMLKKASPVSSKGCWC